MKKIMTLLLVLGMSGMAHAQTLKEVQTQVRGIYAQAMERVQQYAEEPQSCAVTTISSTRTMGGVGLTKTTTEYFCDELPAAGEAVSGTEDLTPFFVRERYERVSIDMGKETFEYLFHPDTHKLIFYFARTPDLTGDEQCTIETRCYYRPNGTYVGGTVQVKGANGQTKKASKSTPDREEARKIARRAQQYVTALDHSINKLNRFD